MGSESKTDMAFLQSLNKGLEKEIKNLKEILREAYKERDIHIDMYSELSEISHGITTDYKKDLESHQQERTKILELLKEIQWDDLERFASCPYCVAYRQDGHDDGCKIAAIIKELEEETEQ